MSQTRPAAQRKTKPEAALTKRPKYRVSVDRLEYGDKVARYMMAQWQYMVVMDEHHIMARTTMRNEAEQIAQLLNRKGR